MNRKQIDRRTLLLGAVTLTAGGLVRKQARADDVAKLQTLHVGAPTLAPVDLALAGPAGQAINLSSFRGKPFLLHVWATWCPPCREELPHLDAFRAASSDITIVPVAIGSGAPEKVAGFLQSAGLAHIGALTADKNAFKAWLGVPQTSIPTTYLIDARGRLRATSEGGLDWAAPDAAKTIRALFVSAT